MTLHRERSNPREAKRKDWKHNDRPEKAWNAGKTQRDREIQRMREEEKEEEPMFFDYDSSSLY